LTPDASPATVLGWARIFARRFEPFGALERDDLVSIGCLRFYIALARWKDHIGDFGAWAVTYMCGGMGEALRREARGKGDARPRVRVPRATQNRLNQQAYYIRTRSLQKCEGCGEVVGRGHGARRCDHCATPAAVANRAHRAGISPVAPTCDVCGMLVQRGYRRCDQHVSQWTLIYRRRRAPQSA